MTFASAARRLWLWAPVFAYLGLIFYLSGQSQARWAGAYPDYLLHAAEYWVLAILLARALHGGLLRRPTRGQLVATWTLCVLYATSDEIHQYFVPGRSADYRDALADAAGAAIGLASLLLLQAGVRSASGAPENPARAVLYSRAGCAPCFAMQRVAGRAARLRGVSLSIVDVDSDPALLRLYGDAVPVLELPGGRRLGPGASSAELDRAFLEAVRSFSSEREQAFEAGLLGGVSRAFDRIRRRRGARA
jgi:hypothetical protein